MRTSRLVISSATGVKAISGSPHVDEEYVYSTQSIVATTLCRMRRRIKSIRPTIEGFVFLYDVGNAPAPGGQQCQNAARDEIPPRPPRRGRQQQPQRGQDRPRAARRRAPHSPNGHPV